LGVNDDNASAEAIELRVNEIGQLFHSLDPFPFRERDLDKEAEEYIVSWARELPHDQPIKIIIHLPEREAQTKAAFLAIIGVHVLFGLATVVTGAVAMLSQRGVADTRTWGRSTFGACSACPAPHHDQLRPWSLQYRGCQSREGCSASGQIGSCWRNRLYTIFWRINAPAVLLWSSWQSPN
jgi:hypothetical protein